MNSKATIQTPFRAAHPALHIPESNEALSSEITRLAAHIAAAEYRFLKLLAALIERDAWNAYGIKSPAHWLNYYCGIGLNAAREKVRVAKALAQLPLIDEAFSKGEISFSKVRAMTRSATPENESVLLVVARHGTAQHVEMLVSKHQRVLQISESMRDRKRLASRELRWWYDDDGMLVFKGRLPPEEGAAFLKAIDALLPSIRGRRYAVEGVSARATETPDVTAVRSTVDAAGPDADADASAHSEGGNGDVPDGKNDTLSEASAGAENVTAVTSERDEPIDTFPQKRADALSLMVDLAMAKWKSGVQPAPTAERFQVLVHLNAGAASMADTCTVEHEGHHTALSREAMQRLACDASLVPVLEDSEGNVLNIGRKTRVVPPAMRRALQLRDQSCRFPGCCEARWVDAHHVVHWCDGGETRLDNLVLLCRRHHRLLHTDGYRIERKETGQFVFHRPDGKMIPHALAPQFADTELGRLCEMLAIEREHARAGLDIDEQTILPKWDGERLDYSYAVCAMRDRDERARSSFAQ